MASRGSSVACRVLLALIVAIGLFGCMRDGGFNATSPPIGTQFISVSATPSPLPAMSTPKTIMASVTPRVALSLTPVPNPGVALIEPIVVAPLVHIYSFSADSKTLAFWAPTNAQDVSVDNPAGQLHFQDVTGGRSCVSGDVVGYTSRFVWLQDGKFVLSAIDGARIGVPCVNGLTVLTDTSQPNLNTLASALSPNGQYRANTIKQGNNTNGLVSLTTRITAVASGQIMNTVPWTIDEGVAAPGEELSLGGQWIAQDLFLIFETSDQGPLLLKVGGKTTQVASELFGLATAPTATIEGVRLQARGATVAGTSVYHIALYGASGSDADFPPIRLYHSDTHQVEILSFKHTWEPVFSPDGSWVLLDDRPENNGHESYALWARALDPAGSQPHKFGQGDALSILWSPNWTEVALGDAGRLSVLTFPDGFEQEAWSTAEYTSIPRAWSPDGKHLAAEGNQLSARQAAVFVKDVP